MNTELPSEDFHQRDLLEGGTSHSSPSYAFVPRPIPAGGSRSPIPALVISPHDSFHSSDPLFENLSFNGSQTILSRLQGMDDAMDSPLALSPPLKTDTFSPLELPSSDFLSSQPPASVLPPVYANNTEDGFDPVPRANMVLSPPTLPIHSSLNLDQPPFTNTCQHLAESLVPVKPSTTQPQRLAQRVPQHYQPNTGPEAMATTPTATTPMAANPMLTTSDRDVASPFTFGASSFPRPTVQAPASRVAHLKRKNLDNKLKDPRPSKAHKPRRQTATSRKAHKSRGVFRIEMEDLAPEEQKKHIERVDKTLRARTNQKQLTDKLHEVIGRPGGFHPGNKTKHGLSKEKVFRMLVAFMCLTEEHHPEWLEECWETLMWAQMASTEDVISKYPLGPAPPRRSDL